MPLRWVFNIGPKEGLKIYFRSQMPTYWQGMEERNSGISVGGIREYLKLKYIHMWLFLYMYFNFYQNKTHHFMCEKKLDNVHKKDLILKFIQYPSCLTSPNLSILWNILPLISLIIIWVMFTCIMFRQHGLVWLLWEITLYRSISGT